MSSYSVINPKVRLRLTEIIDLCKRAEMGGTTDIQYIILTYEYYVKHVSFLSRVP